MAPYRHPALADDTTKDRFAEVAKFFAIAYRAQALVMIVEEWGCDPTMN